MNSAGRDPTNNDPLVQANRIDSVCDEFESSWKRNECPMIEDFVKVMEVDRSTLVVELVKLDLSYRRSTGGSPSIREYIARFPEHAGVLLHLDDADWPDGRELPPPINGLEDYEYIGEGTFGIVWKAEDSNLKRTVAVKVAKIRSTHGSEHELFLHEARSAARIRHDRIVSVHSYGQEAGRDYIVYDFITGRTLRQVLQSRLFSPDEAADICRKLANALQSAHESGVVHRDLKPSNILIDEHGEPHITDFGLAKRDDATATIAPAGHVVGTPAYMSLEQATSSLAVDHRTDIYSLGVMLIQIITGQVALERQESRDDGLATEMPSALVTICRIATARHSRDRYATAEQMSDALTRFLEGRSVSKWPLSIQGKACRWIHAYPKRSVAGVMSIAIAVTTLFAFLPSHVQPREAGTLEVHIPTEPDGAQLVIIPLETSTDEPVSDASLYIMPAQQTPLSWWLRPGRYQVLAFWQQGGPAFAEVVRTVPENPATLPQPRSFQHWKPRGSGQLEWPVVTSVSDAMTESLIMIPGSSVVELGVEGSSDRPKHTRTIRAFYVAPNEFTIDDFVRMRGRRPFAAQPEASGGASIVANFDQAMQWAEESGGRLLTEYEFEYLALLVHAHRHDHHQEISDMTGLHGQELDDLVTRIGHLKNVLSGKAEWVWGTPEAYAIAAGRPPQPLTEPGGPFHILRGGDPKSPLPTEDEGGVLYDPKKREIAASVLATKGCGFRLAHSHRSVARKTRH